MTQSYFLIFVFSFPNIHVFYVQLRQVGNSIIMTQSYFFIFVFSFPNIHVFFDS